jgi:hypothetical protein
LINFLSLIPKKKNPARARRSRLWLQQLNKKKEYKKLKLNKQQTGSKAAAGGKLVLNLAREGQIMPVVTGSLRPILQLDGEVVLDKAKYSLESMYAEEDIIYTLEEIFGPYVTRPITVYLALFCLHSTTFLESSCRFPNACSCLCIPLEA